MWLHAARMCHAGVPAAPRAVRQACMLAVRPVLACAQPRLRRPCVACLAGLQIGQPYSSSAAHKVASSFAELSLIPTLLEALQNAGFEKPTEIQSMAVPAIVSGGDFLLAAQTGSGKTLAYMLPLVHMLKQQEADDAYVRRPKRPKILVLGPTKELTEQITGVAKSLCHFAKFRAVCCNANNSAARQAKHLAAPVDMVVATPTRLLQHQHEGSLALGDVHWLVIDEADTMFDQGFGEEVTQVLDILKRKDPPAQVVLVSATMTRAVKRLADAQLPGLIRLEAAGFHKPTAGARQDFKVLPPGGDKLQLLLEVLQSDVRKRHKVLVFCKSVDSCRAVEHFCQDRDLPTVCYHGDMPIAARKESMAAFAGAAAESDVNAPSIMVATDLAARGLDFPGSIDHVVNFDFPTNAIDYLHRAGRTARAGATGWVTSLVGPRDRKLATAIQYALDNGLPLDQVTASGAQVQPGKRVKGPAPVKGEIQQVVWNPNHKFKHLRNGEPIIPFKELLKGKGGDERKRLLAEIAADVKEWRRWRHAKAVQKAAKRRQKWEQHHLQQAGYSRVSKPAAPEERWKQKVAQKKAKRQAAWEGRGSRQG